MKRRNGMDHLIRDWVRGVQPPKDTNRIPLRVAMSRRAVTLTAPMTRHWLISRAIREWATARLKWLDAAITQRTRATPVTVSIPPAPDDNES